MRVFSLEEATVSVFPDLLRQGETLLLPVLVSPGAVMTGGVEGVEWGGVSECIMEKVGIVFLGVSGTYSYSVQYRSGT